MTTLVFELFGKDNSATRVFREVGQAAEGAGRRLRGAGKDADAASGPLARVRSAVRSLVPDLSGLAGSAAQGALAIGAVGSSALAAAPLVAKAAGTVVEFGQASLAAAPALAALAAGGLFVKTTFARIGPEIGKVLGPIPEMLDRAGTRASALATKGLPQLSSAFSRANFPAVSDGMNKIATATNGVITGFLEWGRSTAGVQAIRNLTTATGNSMISLGPHVTRLVTSFGAMVGRIAEVSLAAGSSGLAGVLDRLSGWMDRVNAATVSNGLAKLKADYEAVKSAIEGAVGWVRQATQFYQEHKVAIGLVADAISLLAIAYAPVPIKILAAGSLIMRHWDDLKAAWQGVTDFFTNEPGPARAAGQLSQAWETVKPGLLAFWEELKAKVGPVIAEIWDKIKNKLIPAVGNLAEAIAPFAKAWLDIFGPTVVALIKGLAEVISGLVDIVSGAINAVSGVLSGDWGRAWEGAKQIAGGAGQIISGAWNATATNLVDTAGRAAAGVTGNLDTIPRNVNTNLTATDNASWVAEQVRLRYSYIPRSVTTTITAIQRTVQGNAAGGIVGMAAGGVVGMAPGGTLSRMSGRLASIVGPNTWRVIGDRVRDDEAFIPLNQSSRSIAILTEAARRMGFDLFRQGVGASGLGGLGGLPSLPSVNPLATGGRAQGPLQLQIGSDGSRLGDLLVEILRNAIRTRGGGDVQTFLGRA